MAAYLSRLLRSTANAQLLGVLEHQRFKKPIKMQWAHKNVLCHELNRAQLGFKIAVGLLTEME